SVLNKSKSYHNRGFLIGKVQQMIELIQQDKLEELFQDKRSVEIMEQFFDSFLPTFTQFSGVILTKEQIKTLKDILASRDIPQLVESLRQLKVDRERTAETIAEQYQRLSDIDFRTEAQKIWASRPRPLEAVRESLDAKGIATSGDLMRTLRKDIDAEAIQTGLAALSERARTFLEGDPFVSAKERAEKVIQSSVYIAITTQLNFLLQTLVELVGTGVVPPEQIKKAQEVIAKTDMAKIRTIGDVVELTRELSLVILREDTVGFVFDIFPTMITASVQSALRGQLQLDGIDIYGMELLEEQRVIIRKALEPGQVKTLKDITDLIRVLLSTVFEETTADFIAGQVPVRARLRFAAATQGRLSDTQTEMAARILTEAEIRGSRDVLNVTHSLLGIFLNEHLVEFVFDEIESGYKSFMQQRGVEEAEMKVTEERILSDVQRDKVKQIADPENLEKPEDILRLIPSLLSSVMSEEMAQFAFNYMKTRLGIDPATTGLTPEHFQRVKALLSARSPETEQELVDLILDIIQVVKETEGGFLREFRIFIETGISIHRMELLPDEKIATVNRVLDPDQVYTATDIISTIHALLATIMSEEMAGVIMNNIASRIGSSIQIAANGKLPPQLEVKAREIIDAAEFSKREDAVRLMRSLMGLVINERVVEFIFSGLDRGGERKAAVKIPDKGKFSPEQQDEITERLDLRGIVSNNDVITLTSSLLETVMSPDMARYTVEYMDSLLGAKTERRLSLAQMERIRTIVVDAEIATPQELVALILELWKVASGKSETELVSVSDSLQTVLRAAFEMVKTQDLTTLQTGRIKEVIEEYKAKDKLERQDIIDLIERLLPIIMTSTMMATGWGLVASRFETFLRLRSEGVLASKVAKIITEAELVTYQDYFDLVYNLSKTIMSEKMADMVLEQLKMRTELLFKSTLGRKIPEDKAAKVRSVIERADTGTFSGVAK
ncbi:MAG: hypothetical protein DRP08_04750, partial [Candidatus Aenigmatarchaeota archaeon]